MSQQLEKVNRYNQSLILVNETLIKANKNYQNKLNELRNSIKLNNTNGKSINQQLTNQSTNFKLNNSKLAFPIEEEGNLKINQIELTQKYNEPNLTLLSHKNDKAKIHKFNK